MIPYQTGPLGNLVCDLKSLKTKTGDKAGPFLDKNLFQIISYGIQSLK